jgi:hypothetical protein
LLTNDPLFHEGQYFNDQDTFYYCTCREIFLRLEIVIIDQSIDRPIDQTINQSVSQINQSIILYKNIYLSSGSGVNDGPICHPEMTTRTQQTANRTQVVESKVEHVSQHLIEEIETFIWYTWRQVHKDESLLPYELILN